MRQIPSNPCKYWAEACPTFFSKMRQMRQDSKSKHPKQPSNPCKY